MVVVVMVGLKGVEVEWRVFRASLFIGSVCGRFFVQGPDSLGIGMACL